MADNHFILRFITEDSDIHLIAESFAFQELRFLDQCPNFVQTFFYTAQAALSFSCAEIHLVTHQATSYEKQLNAGSIAVSPLLLMAFSKTGCSHTGFK